MTMHLGNVDVDQTLYIPFASYDSNGASVTLTGLAVTDIEIYKDGGTTQRASDSGYTLLDTDGIDFDGVTGIHGFSIDLSDNTTAGFYAAGSQYWVIVSSVTIDSQTVNFIAATFTIGPAQANAVQISGDSTAADNLELQYDTTGLTGDTFPATQAQLGNLSTGSAAISAVADTDNTGGAIKGATFTGVETANTFASTDAEDGTYHNVTHSTNTIDIVYGFSLQGNQTPLAAVFHGYLNGNNDTLNIQAYDFVGTAWETRGSLTGQGGSTNKTETITLLARNVGTSGADLGKVYIRLVGTQTSPDLFTDALFLEYTQLDNTSGYEGGAVWLNTNVSNTNTVVGVDGIITNPVSTIAAAKTLLTSTNLNIIHALPGSSYTLADNSDNLELIGAKFTLALGGQSVDSTLIMGASISGTFTGNPRIQLCSIGNITGPNADLHLCGIAGTITNNGASDWFIHHCFSKVAGTGTPTFDFGAAAGSTNLNMRDYSGGIQLEAMGDTGTDTASIEGRGQIIEGTCTGGTVAVRGLFTTSGITNLTLSDDARYDVAQVAAAAPTEAEIWDLANGIETGITPRQSMRAILSATAAIASGGGTNNMKYRDAGGSGDTKDRIDATVDEKGNRTAVILDLT